MNDLTEQWVNIYKSKRLGGYWTGAFCYKTKRAAVKNLADKEHYLTTVNIEDMLNLQTQNAQLKEYERIVTSYNMKPIDYETACETVNKLLDEKKAFKEENTKLKELLKEARNVLKMVDTYYGDYDSTKGFLIVEKISQALGEDK